MAVITPGLIKELREKTGAPLGKCKKALEEANGDLEEAVVCLRKAGDAQAQKKGARSTEEGRVESVETDDVIALVEMKAETDFVVNNERFRAFHKTVAEKAASEKPSNLDELVQLQSPNGDKTLDEERKECILVIGENINISRVLIIPKKENHSYGLYSHMDGKIVSLVTLEGSDKEKELAYSLAMHVAAECPEYLSKDDVPQEILDREKEIAVEQTPKNKPPQIVEKIIQGRINAHLDQICLVEQKYIKDPSKKIGQLVSEKNKSLKIVQFIRWSVGN